MVGAEEGVLFHNRLIHSLKVAQVARRIAERIVASQSDLLDEVGGVDPDVVEAAALAHDLGHPPFGHIAETALDTLTKGTTIDGFEGNAQSFRIVTKLSVRTFDYTGLNLTRSTLNAILKYPWHRSAEEGKQTKCGAYASEATDFRFAREAAHFARYDRKSAEAEIMDWSDDVAYALHDLEDFYRAGWIPLYSLRTEDTEKKRFFEHVHSRLASRKYDKSKLEEAVLDLLRFAPAEAYTGTPSQRAILRAFIARYVDIYSRAIQLQRPPADGDPFVKIDPLLQLQVDTLKELTRFYVISNPSLATQQHGQIHIVKELFGIFRTAAAVDGGSENLSIFPAGFKQRVGETAKSERLRLVIDLIAGMTEKQTVRLYHRLVGIASGSALEPMLHLVQ